MDGQCVKNCASDENSYKIYNTSYIDQCNCLTEKNYIWNYDLKLCARNCTADTQTNNNLNGLNL